MFAQQNLLICSESLRCVRRFAYVLLNTIDFQSAIGQFIFISLPFRSKHFSRLRALVVRLVCSCHDLLINQYCGVLNLLFSFRFRDVHGRAQNTITSICVSM